MKASWVGLACPFEERSWEKFRKTAKTTLLDPRKGTPEQMQSKGNATILLLRVLSVSFPSGHCLCFLELRKKWEMGPGMR